eukprot:TRINITY_DN10190_c0_g1_i1.p1 TRINITY_DN10190_c0_g1~~TRINITY_DN10190_c0_g1_i1.p1  ORF type:complete len:229 (-),score=38.56 TRINITY_DN10190_c0_g1_i1:131-778(-)
MTASSILVILVVLCFISSSFVSGEVIKLNKKARGMVFDKSLLTLDYYGTCTQFESLSTTMKSYSVGSCLPISTGDAITEDVEVSYICQNIRNKVSKIDFTASTSLTTLATDVPFLLSFIPDSLFNSSSGNYLRQPKCLFKTSPCGLPPIVNKCSSQPSIRNKYKKGLFEPLKERVFVVSDNGVGSQPGICKDSTEACCAYVNPTNGICRQDEIDD